MHYTVMAVDILEVASIVWTHPFLASALVLLFTTPLFHLVLFFSPLLISTALCVIALISIGPQIEKIREERERQFKLVGLSLSGAESERPFNRYLIFRRGRHRPPRGRGRGERWTNWVRGIEIRGQSIWLSDSQFMTDIAEENLKADFRDGEGGIEMIEEDFCPSGALTFASAEDSLVNVSNFQTLMHSFHAQIADPLVFVNDKKPMQSLTKKIEQVELEKAVASSNEFQFQNNDSIACGNHLRSTEPEDLMPLEDNGVGDHEVVFGTTEKTSRMFRQERLCEELGGQVLFLEADRLYPTPSTRSKGDLTDMMDFQRIAKNVAQPEVCRPFGQDLKKACEKQSKPIVNLEPSGRNKHQKLGFSETEEENKPSISRCGCFKKRRFPYFFKTSRQKDQKSSV
ncbi:hypothetical protein O6H91_12G009800 [Diphasiastrum complanatum]|uniref:Uncharacterized protein n=2 Tax=Diphasiastrum complanatum TaxID=34168 RepID=A0ACC2BYT3_DIPCM|nr:hypothetical protein O6H91_Y184700 [Diphasiastrum complanatum]KAJ7534915.1 hypothetical protein O6H91_12G009800 [Diphasiastrum complanatum]KAJ7534916.1 hypothetical protein O6H91_12G009800 [Diphasiastrum complanatum]